MEAVESKQGAGEGGSSSSSPPKCHVSHELFDAARWKDVEASGSVAEYYATQEEALEAFEAIETLRSGGTVSDKAQLDAEAMAEQRAISISFMSNVLLFGAKLVAAVMTGSMVVLVSTLDSALDLLSGGILFVTALIAKKPNPMNYPLGKAKMEPLGIVVFSALMGMSALMVAVESIKALTSSQCDEDADEPAVASPDGLETTDGGSLSAAEDDRCLPESYTIDIALTTAIILAGVVVVKTLLYLYCRSVQNLRGSASVQAYADDHFNDALSNGVSVAVFCAAQFYCPDGRVDTPDGSVCPAVILWWMDPLAALLLSLMIFANWVDSGREQLLLLVGHIAPTGLLQQLTYAAVTHEPEHVLLVDKVLAWSVGEYYHAEVDICLAPDMPLQQAHDIGERLEVLIESLEEIERCHVHLDWETEHKAEHQGKDGGLFSLSTKPNVSPRAAMARMALTETKSSEDVKTHPEDSTDAPTNEARGEEQTSEVGIPDKQP